MERFNLAGTALLLLLSSVAWLYPPDLQEPVEVGSSDPLRAEVSTALTGMTSAARYELNYSNYSLRADSPIGRAFLAVLLGEVPAEPGVFEAYDELLKTTSKAPDARENGVLLATGVQSFHIESASERAAQWCTSDARFPATLRTRELEVTYFSEFRRLEFQRHTRGMNLFVPRTLISPFPNSASQVEYFRAARWTSEATTAGGRRLHCFRSGEAHEWLEIDLGPAPAKLPYGCVAFRSGRGSRNGFAAIVQWTVEPGITYWTGLLYAADLGDEIEVSRYERKHTSHEIRDNEVQLPIEIPTSIRDSTSTSLKTYPALDELPAPWRSLIRLGGAASEVSDGKKK